MATISVQATDILENGNGPKSAAVDPPVENGHAPTAKEGKLSAAEKRRQRRKAQKAAKQTTRCTQQITAGSIYRPVTVLLLAGLTPTCLPAGAKRRVKNPRNLLLPRYGLLMDAGSEKPGCRPLAASRTDEELV